MKARLYNKTLATISPCRNPKAVPSILFIMLVPEFISERNLPSQSEIPYSRVMIIRKLITFINNWLYLINDDSTPAALS